MPAYDKYSENRRAQTMGNLYSSWPHVIDVKNKVQVFSCPAVTLDGGAGCNGRSLALPDGEPPRSSQEYVNCRIIKSSHLHPHGIILAIKYSLHLARTPRGRCKTTGKCLSVNVKDPLNRQTTVRIRLL